MRLADGRPAVRALLIGLLAVGALAGAALLEGVPARVLFEALGAALPLREDPVAAGGLVLVAIGVTVAGLYGLVFERVLRGEAPARARVAARRPVERATRAPFTPARLRFSSGE